MIRYESFNHVLTGVAALVLLGGCASTPKSGSGDSKASTNKPKPAAVVVASSAAQKQQFNKALTEIRAGNLETAEKTLQELVATEPKFAAAHNNLGIVYRQRGKFEQAEAAYKAALSADSNNAKAHLNLGILYDIYLQQPAKALTHYERYQTLSASADEEVKLWIADLKQRL